MTPFEERLSNLIEPSLSGLGYELVRVQLNGQVRKTLQIMAERVDNRTMTLDDCTLISETLSAVLDVHDPIKERYALEVSSPGIDRPLTKPAHFERFKGFETKIDLMDMYNGRRHFTGILQGMDNDMVRMLEGKETVEFPYALVQKAKLLLTDELIDAHLAEQDAHNDNTPPKKAAKKTAKTPAEIEEND